MTRRLRLLAAAGAIAVVALTVLPSASAPARQAPPASDDAPDASDERWGEAQNGFRSFLDPEVPEVINGPFSIGGWFEYTPPNIRPQSGLHHVTMVLTPGRPLAEGCPLTFTDDDLDLRPRINSHVGRFDFNTAAICNAVYDVAIVASPADGVVVPPIVPPDETTTTTTEPDDTTTTTEALDPEPDSLPIVIDNLTMAVKPTEVGRVTASYEDGVVGLSWDAPIGYRPGEAPADFIGYRVLRALPDGEFVSVTTDTANPPRQIAFDQLPEGTVGEVRYQVQAARPLPDGSCCLGSDVGPTASATVTVDTPVTAPPPSRRTSRTTGRRSSSNDRPAAPVVDEGFEETLDFEEFEPGLEEAIEPTGRNLLEDEGDDSGPGEGVLVPAATASVLAVWAMHLRYLSRRAGDVP